MIFWTDNFTRKIKDNFSLTNYGIPLNNSFLMNNFLLFLIISFMKSINISILKNTIKIDKF